MEQPLSGTREPVAVKIEPVDLPRCPKCGARKWRVAAAVEAILTVTPTGISEVRLEPNPMDGEGDAVCGECGENLLDWNHGREDWEAHYDERHPAWDAIRAIVPELELPGLLIVKKDDGGPEIR